METRKRYAAVLLIAALLNPGSAPAVAQRTGDFELEIDAPWRMEPRGPNKLYGAIPIQVSIHDADQPATPQDMFLQQIIGVSQRGTGKLEAIFTFLAGAIADVIEGIDSVIEHVLGIELIPFDSFPRIVMLNQFQSLIVYEEINGLFVPRRTFTLANVHEVERTIGLWRYADNQWGPESPYTPPARPAYALCRRWQGQDCSGFAALRPTSEWNLTALYTPAIATPGRDVRLRVELRVSTTEDGDPYTKSYRRTLTVRLGDEPLPKFDTNWAYGDLHYHSQGTDNDGESGYSYRGTLQAMGAMGLDFAFATDHASNSRQIGSAAPIPTDELVLPLYRGLRDLSPDRFAFNLDLLNGPIGGNRQVTSYPRSLGNGLELVAPQLFLGAEVDAIPEAPTGEQSFIQACKEVPKLFKILDQQTPFYEDYWCGTMSDPQPDGRALAFDVQGPANGRLLSSRFYARQHLLHLPVDGQRKDAFIPSNTSKYGGATRRLGEILNVELAQRQKGYVFLAHPFARATGEDVGRLGPDLVPYSAAQLNDAFKSPHVLGLQIWNEDSLFSAKATDLAPFVSPLWETQHQPDHFYDFQRWDILQLYGLDKVRTQALPWLAPNQPRRTFASGGSDAHGDWNYRREGYFLGTDEVSSTAMGTPRNLVYVGAPQGPSITGAAGTGRPVSQRQVVDSLRSGNFSITDGPAVRVVVDVNGNGAIDPADVPMGGVRQHTSGGPIQVIVEWKSSPEFAPVRQVDLLVGVWAAGFIDGIVYTRAYAGPIANASNTYVQPGTGKAFVKTPNFPYWYDPNPGNPLAITPTPSEGYYGKRVVTLDPNLYPMGYDRCILSEPMMKSAGTAKFSSALVGTTAVATRTATAATGTTGGGTPTGGTVVYMKKSIDSMLDDLLNGIIDPPPGCIRREFQDAKRPDRMFIRAEVKNDLAPGSSSWCSNAPLNGEPQCVRRQAFTNPVWVNVEPCGNPITCNLMGTTTGTFTTLGTATPTPKTPTTALTSGATLNLMR